jgi:membrane protein YqaA with SNARE-associated domain
MSTTPPLDPAPAQSIDARRLFLSTLVGIVVLFGFAAAVGYWFREPLEAAARAFVDAFGPAGVLVGFFLPDAFTIPIPNDAFSTFGLVGGLSFAEVVVWGTLGSLAGGSTGWWLGVKLRKTRWVGRLLAHKDGSITAAIRQRGAWIVAIAAITPLPYSLASWTAGAVGMPFGHFFAVSLLRVLRVGGALYLIQLGLG